MNIDIKDRIRGSLIGGAIGDALGYPVEFIAPYTAIQEKYGTDGITRFDTVQGHKPFNGRAAISDDTQMTLFTACGILNAGNDVQAMLPSISKAYVEWLMTQTGGNNGDATQCWISELPELHARRAPGTTCITALEAIRAGHEPRNDSKGCGGIMRIAPIPLYGAVSNRLDINEACRLSADASRLTHKHPLGYMPSAFMAYLIYKLAQDAHPERDTFKSYINEGLDTIRRMYPEHPAEIDRLTYLMMTAVAYADKHFDDAQVIEEELGEGWVAEETAAIAVYCSLAHFDDFDKAIIAAVNHGGDSDSTGSLTGNLLGAATGYEAMSSYYKENVELRNVILHIADDLYNGAATAYRPSRP